MAFCKNCGAQLKDGAKFCAKCGTPVKEVANDGTTSETRKQTFINSVIRKCPHCGAEISSDVIKCPECGFLLEREEVNVSLDEFIKKLTDIFDREQKREYIEAYVVPNNKEAIRDFLNYARTQRDKDYIDDVTKVFFIEAWNNKCRQLVTQASNVFGDDSDFILFLKKINDEIKEASEKIIPLKEQVQKEQKLAQKKEEKYQLKKEKEERNYQRKVERRQENEENGRTVWHVLGKIFGFDTEHKFLSILKYYCLLMVVIVAYESVSGGLKYINFKEQSVTYEIENVSISPDLSEYFDVASPVSVEITDRAKRVTTIYELKCKKSVKDDMDKKLASFLQESNKKVKSHPDFSCYAGYNDFTSNTDEIKILVNMKPGETNKFAIETFKEDDSKAIDNAVKAIQSKLLSIIKNPLIYYSIDFDDKTTEVLYLSD